QLENRALLPEVLVRDVEQLVPEVELDIGARHSHGEREAGRGPVGLGRLDTRAGRGEKRAVAAPEIDLEAEVEREARIGHVAAGVGRRKQAVLRVALPRRLGVERPSRKADGARRDRIPLRGAQPRLRDLERWAAAERLIDERIQLRIPKATPPALRRPGRRVDLRSGERLAGGERLRLESRRALPAAALDAARESRGEGQRKYHHGELAGSHGFGPVEKPLFSP